MLTARNLRFARGRRLILDGVDFAARPGEFTAIIGPNGSGKTTLLRALSGDLSVDGEVRLSTRLLRDWRPAELAARRAVLEQQSLLGFPFTVAEVVGMGIGLGGETLSPEDCRTRPLRALERVDLAGFANRLYPELSGGEQQRVQLARILCQVWEPLRDGEARWLLLDEPVSSLDIRHQLRVMQIASDFAAAGGGVVAILHDLNLAALHADHIVALSDGRIAAAGSPAEVLTPSRVEAVFGCALTPVALPSGPSLFAPQLLPHIAS
jgi:iron complex transport system ATP-binding protein